MEKILILSPLTGVAIRPCCVSDFLVAGGREHNLVCQNAVALEFHAIRFCTH